MIEISLVVIIILTWMYFLHKIWVYSFKVKPLHLHVKKLNEERHYEIKRLKHGIQVILINYNNDFIEMTTFLLFHLQIETETVNTITSLSLKELLLKLKTGDITCEETLNAFTLKGKKRKHYCYFPFCNATDLKMPSILSHFSH